MMRLPYASSLVITGIFLAACGSSTDDSDASGGNGGVPSTPSTGGAGTGGGGGSSGSLASGAGPSTTGGASAGTSSSGGASSGGSAGNSGGSAGSSGGSAGSSGGSAGSTSSGGSAGSSAGSSGSSGSAGSAGAAGSSGSAGSSGGPATDPGTDGDGNFTVGPSYSTAAEVSGGKNPAGRTFSFTMNSTDSKFYTGMDSTLNQKKSFTRKIDVYIPKQFKAGTPAPLMIVHDGGGTAFSLIKAGLDNLTIETNPARRLPPFVAIAVANGGGDSKGSQRGLEYDTMSGKFAQFLDEEVLPAIVARSDIQAAYPGFSFTKDPEGRGTAGCSSGGAAAVSMAWFRPDLFRKVIAYSATLVDQQDDDAAEEKMYPLGAWDYHSGLNLIGTSEKKPVRMMINANENDNGYDQAESGHHNWLMANERTAASFKSKNYHYKYVLGKGLGHCDGKVMNQTMGDVLMWLWRGYQAPTQ